MATIRHLPLRRAFAVVAAAAAMAWAGAAQAHCDTLDGPVVSDARRALDTGFSQAPAVPEKSRPPGP